MAKTKTMPRRKQEEIDKDKKKNQTSRHKTKSQNKPTDTKNDQKKGTGRRGRSKYFNHDKG